MGRLVRLFGFPTLQGARSEVFLRGKRRGEHNRRDSSYEEDKASSSRQLIGVYTLFAWPYGAEGCICSTNTEWRCRAPGFRLPLLDSL